MRRADAVENLARVLDQMEDSLRWLRRSRGICEEIGLLPRYSEAQFDAFETLTGRFARTTDLLVHKLFRAIDAVELEEGGTLIDVVNRAHKRGLFDEVDQVRLVKDLRNSIAHEYVQEAVSALFGEVLEQAPFLFEVAERAREYCRRYVA